MRTAVTRTAHYLVTLLVPVHNFLCMCTMLILIFFLKHILLGFLHFIVQYNYENWVWLGLELGAKRLELGAKIVTLSCNLHL